MHPDEVVFNALSTTCGSFTPVSTLHGFVEDGDALWSAVSLSASSSGEYVFTCVRLRSPTYSGDVDTTYRSRPFVNRQRQGIAIRFKATRYGMRRVEFTRKFEW